MTEKIGIMVVHGIGNPAPGDALHNLTDALQNGQPHPQASLQLRFGLVEEQRLPSQAPWQAWKAEFFPMFIRRCRADCAKVQEGEAELVFAEVFWGNASQLPVGLMGMIQGVVRLFFRSEVLVRAAAEGQTAPGEKVWLRRLFYGLMLFDSRLLTGPIFALNVLLLIAFTLYQYFGWTEKGAMGLWPPSLWIGGLALALAAIVLLIDKWRPKSVFQNLGTPAWWLGGIVLGWWAALGWNKPATLEGAATPLIGLLGFIFLVLQAGMVAIILLRGLHWFAQERATITGKKQGPPLTIAFFSIMVQYALWVTIIPSLWQLLLRNHDKASTPGRLLQKMVETDGLQWIALLVVALFGFLSWVMFWWQTRQKLTVSLNAEPRLIVHSLLAVPFALVTLVTVMIVVYVGITKLLAWPRYEVIELILGLLQSVRDKYLLTILVSLLPVVLSFTTGALQNALDLVNDIINYIDQEQQRSPQPTKPEGGRWSNILYKWGESLWRSLLYRSQSLLDKFGLKQLPSPSINRTRSLTREIRPRFALVLEHLIQTEQITKLVVVAHSQGSVIALDELADPNNVKLEQWGKNNITFVTVGSPISHLYQHYFPGRYPLWEETKRWAVLYRRVQYWRHYYRQDDYIGMELDATLKTKVTNFDQNCLGLGAHSDYWQDDRFIAKFQQIVAEVIALKSFKRLNFPKEEL